MTAPLRVAVLGAGTVGREVVRALLDRPGSLHPVDGASLELVGVAVRDVARAVAGGIPEGLLTDAPAHLVADGTTDVVVELLGGDEPARTLIAAALGAGKPVVTANKLVVARHGPELEAAARRTGTALRFEAAVGGGLPILGPLAVDLAANRVTGVRGIVNGSTNFLLTAMANEHRPYADVLGAAQAAGYLEADPRADVEGHDAVDKLVILARLAFARWIEPASIAIAPQTIAALLGPPGITGVTLDDVVAAAARGFAIKLVARAVAVGDRIAAGVLPSAVPFDLELGRTDGVLNRVEVSAEPVGMVAFSGPGAGGPATSSAVLGDLVAVARQLGSTWAGLAPAAGVEPALPLPGGETFVGPSGTAYPVVR